MGNQESFDEMHRETSTQRGPSRSFLADNGNGIDTPLGIAWNSDANIHQNTMTWGYLFDVPLAVKVVEYVAKNGVYPGTWAAQPENAWWAQFGQSYCQGLMKFKKNLNGLFGTIKV